MNFSDRLKQRMESASVTQTQLADATGLSQPTISRYRAGTTAPRHDDLVKIAEALRVSPHWLLTGQGEERPWGEVLKEDAAHAHSFGAPPEVAQLILDLTQSRRRCEQLLAENVKLNKIISSIKKALAD